MSFPVTVGDDLGDEHPWSVFVKARREAIVWLIAECNESNYEIARLLDAPRDVIALIRAELAAPKC